MLTRIRLLLDSGETFAFETTLATRSYVNTVKKAQSLGYNVILLYFWLNTKSLAKKRVELRVKEGGHDIPEKVIERRYDLGMSNMLNLYIPIVDHWVFIDNSKGEFTIVAEGEKEEENIAQTELWEEIRKDYEKGY